MYGVSTSNAIFAIPVNGAGSWRRIPGTLKYITGSGRTEVFGINTRNQILRCKKPCIGEWERMSGALMQCDATFDSVVGGPYQPPNLPPENWHLKQFKTL